MTEDGAMTPDPVSEPPKPSPTNFAGALLLSVLLVIAWGLNTFSTFFTPEAAAIVPNWLLYGLMFGILFLLGVDVSKLFRGRGDP